MFNYCFQVNLLMKDNTKTDEEKAELEEHMISVIAQRRHECFQQQNRGQGRPSAVNDVEDEILAEAVEIQQRIPLLALEEGGKSTTNGFYSTGAYEGPTAALQH